ncbi:MAG: MmcQ/YjbR family DNA-binding protein [Actinomycetota bacterium]|nr:MmcQ/YjbR family DNA-binding protein [Actinomycetota bacterium]
MDWDEVRRLALALPDVEEGTSWGAPSLKVGGRWFAGMSPHREARGALVVRCEPEERPLMLAGRPDLFYLTPHYEGADGYVLVRLEAASVDDLRERLEDAWRLAREHKR